tara:strand:- start:187 stop:660 length:474 start_codon:yes stop_codon:yes gene_type:complete
MSNSWSKEDRQHYKNSEVMKELESAILKNISRLDILSKKALDTQEVSQGLDTVQQKAESVTQTMKALNETISSADDGEGMALGDSKEHHNVKVEVQGEGSFDDAADSDDAEDQLKQEAVGELREMAKIASDKGNYKLAYKIERTIDEILEESVACEL